MSLRKKSSFADRNEIILEKEKNRKEQLQLKKLHDEASWSKKRRILTWLVIIIVLLGLTYYYYNKYQPTGTAAKGRNVEEKSQPLKSTTKTAPKNNNKSSNKKSMSGKNPPKTSSPSANSKKKTESKKPTKTSPPAGSNKYHPSSKITDLPILRRPIPPSDPDRPLIIEILAADDSLEVKAYDIAVEKFDAILNRFPQSPRGLLGKAMALEGAGMKSAKPKFTLDKAIDLYYQVGFDSFLASEDLKLHALIRLAKCADLRSKHTLTVKALEFAAKLEPENPTLLTRLGQAYIKANKLTKAKTILDNVITKWPNNTLALASIGYLLYREDNCTGALQLFLIGLSENEEVRQDGRFYIYAGECMTKLNKTDEAKMLYNEGVQRGLFPSVDQRSVYNENGLEAKPWWDLSETKESILLKFEEKTDAIKHEIALAINNGLMEDHSMILYSKGTQNPKGCQAVPETCNILSRMTSAETCKRGETKVVLLQEITHEVPAVGETNAILQALLPVALSGTLEIRVGNETRTLEEGKMAVADYSFEHEMWYTGTDYAALLMIQFWHPNLSKARRSQLDILV